MKINLEQGTREWLDFRKNGLGSSDAPVIMGASPWKTPKDLFMERMGNKKPFKSNAAMERGTRLEPVARAHYELFSGLDFEPVVFQDTDDEFLYASLDGWNDNGTILEIKCPGRLDHVTALHGQVPEKYIYQLMHQAMVSRAKKIIYFSFDGEKGVAVELVPDPKLMNLLRATERRFWRCIQSGQWNEDWNAP